MKQIILFYYLLAVCLSCTYCKSNEESSIIEKQFISDSESVDECDYAYCVMNLHTTFYEKSNYCSDAMECFMSAGHLYELIKDSSMSKKEFRKTMGKKSVKHLSTYIPPTSYAKLEEYRIRYDREIASIYSEKGIPGILELLSTKEIIEWEKNDYYRFLFIASLCWEHDIVFGWTFMDEAPLIKYYIDGNEELLKKFYHPVVPDDWHPISQYQVDHSPIFVTK